MKCFQLIYDYEKYGNVTCLETNSMYGINRYDLEKGIRIDNWDSNFTFYYKNDNSNFIDYQANTLTWFIISEKMRKLIEEMKCKDIQFLPITIKNENSGEERKDYYVVNVFLTLNDVFDFNSTQFIGEKPNIGEPLKRVKFYAINEKKINDFHLFKIQENPSILFISEELKNHFTKNKIKGCDFKKVIMI